MQKQAYEELENALAGDEIDLNKFGSIEKRPGSSAKKSGVKKTK